MSPGSIKTFRGFLFKVLENNFWDCAQKPPVNLPGLFLFS